MKNVIQPIVAAITLLGSLGANAEIGIISPEEAKKLIEDADAKKRPIVLDTRGGYKDYFRGHIPTAHHLEFDTLRGTDQSVPVQYLPNDLTKALLVRAGVNKDRTHLVYATGAELPNDEVLSATMVAYVLEKHGITEVRIVDGGLPAWKSAGFQATQEYFGNAAGKLSTKGKPEIALTAEQVISLKDKPGHILVDARPKNEYLGPGRSMAAQGSYPRRGQLPLGKAGGERQHA
jgi:thiosulfate/3-mercaptopyruvate sulfurtransferase